MTAPYLPPRNSAAREALARRPNVGSGYLDTLEAIAGAPLAYGEGTLSRTAWGEYYPFLDMIRVARDAPASGTLAHEFGHRLEGDPAYDRMTAGLRREDAADEFMEGVLAMRAGEPLTREGQALIRGRLAHKGLAGGPGEAERRRNAQITGGVGPTSKPLLPPLSQGLFGTGTNLDKSPDFAAARDSLVTAAAKRFGVPVSLALAVSRVENTRGIPTARGKGGEVGLMQIMPSAHGLDPKALEDPEMNVNFGIRLLRGLFEKHGSWETALRAYNGALQHPEAGDAYYNKIRAQLRSQIGKEPSAPVSSRDRSAREALAVARRAISDSRFTESERRGALETFHAAQKR